MAKITNAHPTQEIHGKLSSKDDVYYYTNAVGKQLARKRTEDYQQNRSPKQRWNNLAFAYAHQQMPTAFANDEATRQVISDWKDSSESFMKRIAECIDEESKSEVQLLGSITNSKKKMHFVEVCGGLNGTGEWSDYLLELSSFVKKLMQKFEYVALSEEKTDLLDDMFYAYFEIVEK